MKISVIVPAYGCSSTLGRCLEGLFASDFKDFECVVVDDGSPDDFTALLKPYPVKLIKLDRRRGPAFARNRGADAAAGDILFFLDSDVRPHADTLGRTARFMDEQPGVVAVFGSYDDTPGETGFFSQYRNLFHHYTHQVAREKAMTFWAGCGAVRRDIFLKVGGFDESYSRPCVEDIELGYRLNRNGHEVRLDRNIQAAHLKKWTLPGIIRSDVFDRALPWTQLLLGLEKMPNDLNVTMTARISTLLLGLAIACACAGILVPLLLIPAAGLLIIVVLLNKSVYLFFLQKRGFIFTLGAVAMHLMYLLYSGAAFALGALLPRKRR